MIQIFMHPAVFLILAGIVSAFVPKIVRHVLIIAAPAIALIFALQLHIGDTLTITPYRGTTLYLIDVNNQNYLFLIIFAVLALVAGFFSAHNGSRLEAFASMGYVGGAIGVTIAGDWLTLLFFWEFMAVTSLFLIWAKHTKEATKAGFRYLLIHMFGGNFLLFGIAIKVAGDNLMITNLAEGPHDLAFWLIFIGVIINASVVPVHFWVPDAYPNSTLTGGVYLSSCTTKLAALCLARMFLGFDFLIVMGLIMIFWGALCAMMENDIRKLLSYHIISQLGYMVADAGLGEEIGFNACTAIAYSNIVYKSLLFMCAAAIIYATGKKHISELGGLAKKMPFTCIIFFIAAFSIAGMPPLAGFTCKSWSILAAEEAGMHLVVLLMMVGSITTALSIPFKMGYFIFLRPGKDVKIKRQLPWNMKVGMAMGAALCIFTGAFPQVLYRFFPYAIEYHPYTLPHVLEYVQLLPAALIPFLIFLNIMEPHHKKTMDLDWFARLGGQTALFGFSRFICWIQDICAGLGRGLYHRLQIFTGNPYRFLGQNPHNKGVTKENSASHFKEDAYRLQIGSGMLFVVIGVLFIGLFILVMHYF